MIVSMMAHPRARMEQKAAPPQATRELGGSRLFGQDDKTRTGAWRDMKVSCDFTKLVVRF